jgi:hypothetical protein
MGREPICSGREIYLGSKNKIENIGKRVVFVGKT